jgi:hypothetical protein
MIHFPSKLRWEKEDQAMECTSLSNRIAREEDAVGHRRTVLVGDLNMNPFETGMIAAAGLNSVMTRSIAAREERVVQGIPYRIFYNPMWSLFGDGRAPTSGSYFYDNGKHVNYYWHIFDQVLLRPWLAERFAHDSLEIVTTIDGRPLIMGDGRPNKRMFSDHLPILFDLEF